MYSVFQRSAISILNVCKNELSRSTFVQLHVVFLLLQSSQHCYVSTSCSLVIQIITIRDNQLKFPDATMHQFHRTCRLHYTAPWPLMAENIIPTRARLLWNAQLPKFVSTKQIMKLQQNND